MAHIESGVPLYQKTHFTKCSFCKIFSASDKHPSGHSLHYHDYMQIWYIQRGRCEHIIGDEVYHLTAGDAFLIPPGVSHQTLLKKDSQIISCEFSIEDVLTDTTAQNVLNIISFSALLQKSQKKWSHLWFYSDTGAVIEELMTNLLQEYNEEPAYYQEMLKLRIQQLLLLMLRQFESSNEYQAVHETYQKHFNSITEACRYIDENLGESITLNELCQITALSKTYFCQLFKLIKKKTFVEYLNERRIAKARDLLKTSKEPIQSIAEQLGFYSASHFSITFKKHTGISPSAYRKSHRTDLES